MNVQNKPEAALSRYTYLNPDFMPDHVNKECYRRRKASKLSYDLHALLSTLHAAAENDNLGVPMDQRGIDKTLEIAANMAGDLIDLCESVEADARAKGETDKSNSEGSARIQELFREHLKLSDEGEAYVSPKGTDHAKLLEALYWDRCDSIKEEMFSIPSETAADFAAKTIVDTLRGDVFTPWNSKFWKEARELVGMPDLPQTAGPT